MPITRTPIVDDDGTGTTGTVLDNAWKQQLYDQIDAAFGTGALRCIGAAIGSTSSAAPEMITQVKLPVGTVGPLDTVVIEVELYMSQLTPLPNCRLLYAAGATQVELVNLKNFGQPAGGTRSITRTYLRAINNNDNYMHVHATGGDGPTAGVLATFIQTAFWANGEWWVYLNHDGLTNPPMQWKMTGWVQKVITVPTARPGPEGERLPDVVTPV